MCHKPSGFYCKDTGVAVCSSECKKDHINYIASNPALDFQYDEKFKNEIERLLFSNLRSKKSVPLTI
jgi:hypothetical protein